MLMKWPTSFKLTAVRLRLLLNSNSGALSNIIIIVGFFIAVVALLGALALLCKNKLLSLIVGLFLLTTYIFVSIWYYSLYLRLLNWP